MEINWLAVLVAAIVPMVIGSLWYSPILFQKAWMKESGVTEETMKGSNMALIFGLAFVLSLLMAAFLQSLVIHAIGVIGLVGGPDALADATNEAGILGNELLSKFGGNFRTFGHGAFHGVLMGLLIVLPIMGSNALFERKSFKYVMLNVGYWTVTLALMSGILSAWQ